MVPVFHHELLRTSATAMKTGRQQSGSMGQISFTYEKSDWKPKKPNSRATVLTFSTPQYLSQLPKAIVQPLKQTPLLPSSHSQLSEYFSHVLYLFINKKSNLF